MNTTAAVALLGVLLAPFLTGCATPTGTSSAEAMLTLAPTPPGSTKASAFPDPVFREPAQQPACHPLDLRTAYWTSNLTGPAVVAYLTAHPGPHFRVGGTGTGTGGSESWSVRLDPVGGSAESSSDAPSPPMLVYTIAPLTTGVGIRADAEVVRAGASCTRS